MYSAIPRKQFFTLKSLYLLLAIAGSIIPWTLLSKFFLINGLSVNLFFQNAFDNSVASGISSDLLISSFVFFCFSFVELKRLNLSGRWLILYVCATLGIGLSCSLPLFLYLRERELEKVT
ncbi:MAG: DUF2834 domain-containing protein [Cyanobacteria bacterium P01_A01_bin.45]|mgnify:CR=1 FL=1